jgi:hypothetical protein
LFVEKVFDVLMVRQMERHIRCNDLLTGESIWILSALQHSGSYFAGDRKHSAEHGKWRGHDGSATIGFGLLHLCCVGLSKVR